MTTAADLVVARHRECESHAPLLVAMCEEDTVRMSASPDASAADIKRGETYLGRCCRSSPTSILPPSSPMRRARHAAPVRRSRRHGISDRDLRLVRETRKFTVSGQLASRVTPNAVTTRAADPARRQFAAMWRLGIALRSSRSRDAGVGCRRIAVSWSIGAAARAGSAEAARSSGRRAASPPRSSAARRLPRLRPGTAVLRIRLLPLADTRSSWSRRRPLSKGCPRCWPVGRLHSGRPGARRGVAGGVVRRRSLVRAACVTSADFADRVARGDDMKLEPSAVGA